MPEIFISKGITNITIENSRVNEVRLIKQYIREQLFNEFSKEVDSSKIIDNPFFMIIKEIPVEEDIRLFEGRLRWRKH